MAGHGAQKLFGSFGGPGRRGTAGFFGSLGFHTPMLTALVAGLAEFVGGTLVAIGFLTPIGAFLIAVTMVVAVATVHWEKGFWSTAGGYEFNLLIWATAVGLAAIGGGRYSIDSAIGWWDNLSGGWWGLGVAAGSVAIGLITIAVWRERRHAVAA
jgi:putative oxidoreductase